MVRDPYGNYVVQKILDIADDRQQEALCSYLRCVPARFCLTRRADEGGVFLRPCAYHTHHD